MTIYLKKLFEAILNENNEELSYYPLDIQWRNTFNDIIKSIKKLVKTEKFGKFSSLAYVDVYDECIGVNIEDIDELIHCIWSIAKTERIDNGDPDNKNIHYSYLNADWKDITALANSLGRIKNSAKDKEANLEDIEDRIRHVLYLRNRNTFDNYCAYGIGYKACKKINKKECIICIYVGEGFTHSEVAKYFSLDDPIELEGYKVRLLDDDEAEEFCWDIPYYEGFSGFRSHYMPHGYITSEGLRGTNKAYCQFYKYTKI